MNTIDNDMLGSNDFPFAQRVRERNAVIAEITGAYNKSVTPALLAMRERDKEVDDWARKEIEKITKEASERKRANVGEYYDAIKPHRDVYEAAIAEAAKNNPLWRHEVNEG